MGGNYAAGTACRFRFQIPSVALTTVDSDFLKEQVQTRVHLAEDHLVLFIIKHLG